MRKHKGMRPQDVAILLKITALKDENFQLTKLAFSLYISASEVSESLNRSRLAGLIDYNKMKVNKQSFLEFLEFGLKYVFPQQPGTLTRGIPTAHSHAFMKKVFSSEINYVWPTIKGEVLGLAIEPLYPKQIEAIENDSDYYKLLALVDVIRVGKIREVKFAITGLKTIFNESSSK